MSARAWNFMRSIPLLALSTRGERLGPPRVPCVSPEQARTAETPIKDAPVIHRMRPRRRRARLTSARRTSGRAASAPNRATRPARRFATPAVDANDVQGKLAEREPFRIALFHRRQRLAGQPGEGMNLFPQCERLSRAGTVFQSVPVALWSAATRPMHPTDLRPPHGWRAAL